ncbi:CDC42 small effector protein 2 isoform X1 [Aquila chrysaetos chrysaetos]|uniref:CDC42 small effector protein 2 isoform X1 n=1 Tax=Aquila chrysaetos chrysaetos TaxID=223781 RepID=UPI001B7D404B|nr:CDC42 small effector protein 2 isoform X1 [Aquila chrysaetos chrysaetos]
MSHWGCAIRPVAAPGSLRSDRPGAAALLREPPRPGGRSGAGRGRCGAGPDGGLKARRRRRGRYIDRADGQRQPSSPPPGLLCPSPPRRAQPSRQRGAGRPGDSLPAPPRSPSSPPTSPRTLPAGLPGARGGGRGGRAAPARPPAACDRRAVAASSADLVCVLLRPQRGGEGARGARQRGTEVPGRGVQTKERAPPWAAGRGA